MRESWSIVRDPSEFHEKTTIRGRWERDNPQDSMDTRFRHYVRVGRIRIRVPWIAWAMFS